MASSFDCFILIADMRTGSNLLESHLNAFPGVQCHGEAFNPHFTGFPKRDNLLGVTLRARESNPLQLIDAIRQDSDGIGGFRFFHDHDKRALDQCLADRRCAKIILTRNPADSYVSWKIAQSTGQWKLTNEKHRKSARIRFDPAEFETFLTPRRAFQDQIRRVLQTSGQTAFHIDYAELQDRDVINGLGAFLGVDHRLKSLAQTIKKQNPAALQDKVENFAEMQTALAGGAHATTDAAPAEPARGAGVPGYLAGANSPLLYLPMAGPQHAMARGWLAALDGEGPDALRTGFTQKSLRQWKRQNPGHRSFTVVSHPAPRAHWAFCQHILTPDDDSYRDIRDTLRRVHGVPLPKGGPDDSYDLAQHRQAFLGFLGFVKENLSGQTGLRVDPIWASQSQRLQDHCQIAAPDMVVRAETLDSGLEQLSAQIEHPAPTVSDPVADQPFSLSDIYDEDVEAAVRAAYQRDYMSFGYRAWRS